MTHYDSILLRRKFIIIIIIMSRDNVVDVVTKLQTERLRVRVLAGSRLCLFLRTSRPAVGLTQPLVQWEIMLFLWVKVAGA
jgi:hypothetical protein